MQPSLSYRDTSYISLGERRGKSDLARFSLDVSWARAVSDSARSRPYPSPPMSGSPPPPATQNLDSGDRSHGVYAASGQDVYPGIRTPHSEVAEGRTAPMRTYAPEQQYSTPPYPPYRMEDMQTVPPPLSYQQRGPPIPQHLMQQPLPAYRPQIPQGPAPFSTPDRPPTGERPEYSSSPKAQRKTKGHVASACVPCKRAHLRCDAQRPCSRCLANGKEEACVDVQHKKRGRPRLRDEREQRFESLGPTFSHAQHESALRRPLSYAPEPTLAQNFGEPLSRANSYRVLKSQGQGPLAPRYLEHGSPADPNMYSGPIAPAARMMPAQEPLCAYLTMEMQIAKTTRSFGDAIGSQLAVSRRLQEIVSPNDVEKVGRLQRIFEEERREREPNYLPPIFLQERMLQSLGFGPDEIRQWHLSHQEVLTFPGPEGQQRILQARFGLAKHESMYFIAVIFQVPVPATPPTFAQPSPSSYMQPQYSRESQYGYQTPQQQFPSNPSPSTFIPGQGFNELREGSTMYRPPGPLRQMAPAPAPAPMPASMPAYAAGPTRPDYSSPSQRPYQTPRSELPQGQSTQHNLQLPPIRGSSTETFSSSANPDPRRDDRGGRLDIGGLLERTTR